MERHASRYTIYVLNLVQLSYRYGIYEYVNLLNLIGAPPRTDPRTRRTSI
eukprot:SAG31_NODE_24490_length_480_cov_1.020997_2_plen_49_part_01